MQKKLSTFCYICVIALTIILLIVGILQIKSQNTENQNTDNFVAFKKFLRDSIITFCTFAIGYFTILFQLSTRDKYGHSIKQEDHFEIFYLLKQSKESPENEYRRVLPLKILLPYPVYIFFVLVSTILYFIDDSHKWPLYALYVLFSVSICFMCIYVIYMLRIIYSRDWIIHAVDKICDNVGKTIEDNSTTQQSSTKTAKLIIASKALRILAESDYSLPNDIAEIHSKELKNTMETMAVPIRNRRPLNRNNTMAVINDETLQNEIEICIFYYTNLIISYCIAGAGTNEFKNLKTLVDSYFTCNDRNFPAKDYPYFAIATIAACRELKIMQKMNIRDSKYHRTLRDRYIHNYINESYEWLSDNYNNFKRLSDNYNNIDDELCGHKTWVGVLYHVYANTGNTYKFDKFYESELYKDNKNIFDTAMKYFGHYYVN